MTSLDWTARCWHDVLKDALLPLASRMADQALDVDISRVRRLRRLRGEAAVMGIQTACKAVLEWIEQDHADEQLDAMLHTRLESMATFAETDAYDGVDVSDRFDDDVAIYAANAAYQGIRITDDPGNKSTTMIAEPIIHQLICSRDVSEGVRRAFLRDVLEQAMRVGVAAVGYWFTERFEGVDLNEQAIADLRRSLLCVVALSPTAVGEAIELGRQAD